MLDQAANQRNQGYLDYRGIYWRSVAGLLLFQAAGWGLAALLAYHVARPEIAKDYFSAHQSSRSTLQLLVPALAFSAGAGFLAVGLGSAVGLWRYSRRLRRPLLEIDGVFRQVAAGRLPSPGPAVKRPRPTDEAVVLLEPLRTQVAELQRVTKGIQKSVLELNYRAGAANELQGIAGQLDVLAKELGGVARWFEG